MEGDGGLTEVTTGLLEGDEIVVLIKNNNAYRTQKYYKKNITIVV